MSHNLKQFLSRPDAKKHPQYGHTHTSMNGTKGCGIIANSYYISEDMKDEFYEIIAKLGCNVKINGKFHDK